MTITRTLIAAAAAALALTLGGCWDDDDDVVAPGAIAEVPDSAGVSSAAFISYLLTLGATDEAAEPSIIRDVFAVPADESSEPTPLT